MNKLQRIGWIVLLLFVILGVMILSKSHNITDFICSCILGWVIKIDISKGK